MKAIPPSAFQVANRRVIDKVVAHTPAEYYLIWGAVLAGPPCMMLILNMVGMTLDISSSGRLVVIIAALVGAHVLYSRYRSNRAFAAITGALALFLPLAISWGVFCNAGLRLRRPLIDGLLVQSDRAIGVDAADIVMFFANRPLAGQIVFIAYAATFAAVGGTALWLAATGRHARLWELCWGFAGGLVGVAVISTLLPAIGNIPYLHLDQVISGKLPPGSGTSYVAAFHELRDGGGAILDPLRLAGISTFPSFHGTMAIVTAYAFRRTGLAGWVALIWCALVMISTVPIGGHYVIDLIGSVVLWASCIGLATVIGPLESGFMRRRFGSVWHGF